MKKWIQKQKPEILLLIFSLFILIGLGIFLSYNFKLGENYNLLFDSDTARVVKDAIELNADHYRSSVHPLFVLLIQPIALFLLGIVFNKSLALIILSSTVSAFSVYFLYKILDHIKPNKKINSVISLIYLFSFANMVFTSGIETYNFAALFLIMMWYFYIKQENKPLNGYSYVLLVLFGILTFAFTMTNVCIYLIMILLLWISKKINIKQIIVIGVITLSLVVGLNITQKLVFHTTPVLWNFSMKEEQTFMNKEKFGKQNIKEVIINDYYHSLIGNDIEMKQFYGNYYNGQNYYISFKDMNLFHFLFISIFYILCFFLVIRNFKKKLLLNSALVGSLLFNTFLHLFYGNNTAFLYSLHFLYIIILLFGINLLLEENNKLKSFSKVYVCIFLLGESILNLIIFGKVINYVRGVIPSNILVSCFGLSKTMILEVLIIIIVMFLVILGIWALRKIIHTSKIEGKVLYALIVLFSFFACEWIFIGLQNTENFHRFLWIKLEEKETQFEAKEKMDYLDQDFKTAFKQELKELDAYKEEINLLKEEYETVSVVDTGWSDYYYFGMANRRKLVYRPNMLIDIETKEEILHFDEKEHYIIPNTYTVLIETKENDKIILKEDEVGVHYIVNGKDTIIEHTDTYLSLYTFENEKYKNIKKVLYGEILWNIKEGVIYPNIIVYDKPWYRDAAITCMVLKETNNLDLIRDWVLSLHELYDKQNKGVEEADNLGELLYILSTQEGVNPGFIDTIEEEAERIATSNQNGYYLYGKTDFGDQYLYQNLWYQLGIESVGRSYHFDRNSIPEDSYSKMAWWSNYEIKNKNNQMKDQYYPYLSYAERHTLKTGEIAINENLYPLSWEIAASEANYDSYLGIDDYMAKAHVSPLHSWAASEFLLLLLEDTGHLH